MGKTLKKEPVFNEKLLKLNFKAKISVARAQLSKFEYPGRFMDLEYDLVLRHD